MCSVCGGRRAAGASPIRCVGERITATGVPEFREVAWRACTHMCFPSINPIHKDKPQTAKLLIKTPAIAFKSDLNVCPLSIKYNIRYKLEQVTNMPTIIVTSDARYSRDRSFF
nr:hypothetical protein [Bathymodiolus japonicus methanotrophic gill symbiont]